MLAVCQRPPRQECRQLVLRAVVVHGAGRELSGLLVPLADQLCCGLVWLPKEDGAGGGARPGPDRRVRLCLAERGQPAGPHALPGVHVAHGDHGAQPAHDTLPPADCAAPAPCGGHVVHSGGTHANTMDTRWLRLCFFNNQLRVLC